MSAIYKVIPPSFQDLLGKKEAKRMSEDCNDPEIRELLSDETVQGTLRSLFGPEYEIDIYSPVEESQHKVYMVLGKPKPTWKRTEFALGKGKAVLIKHTSLEYENTDFSQVYSRILQLSCGFFPAGQVVLNVNDSLVYEDKVFCEHVEGYAGRTRTGEGYKFQYLDDPSAEELRAIPSVVRFISERGEEAFSRLQEELKKRNFKTTRKLKGSRLDDLADIHQIHFLRYLKTLSQMPEPELLTVFREVFKEFLE